jgi:hypothetical protein
MSHIKGRTQTKDVREWATEGDIWICEKGSYRRLEKIAQKNL